MENAPSNANNSRHGGRREAMELSFIILSYLKGRGERGQGCAISLTSKGKGAMRKLGRPWYGQMTRPYLVDTVTSGNSFSDYIRYGAVHLNTTTVV
jgi:hypothetical protein